jgi:hypothetical protein
MRTHLQEIRKGLRGVGLEVLALAGSVLVATVAAWLVLAAT